MPRIPVAQNQYEMRALPQVQRARLVDNTADVIADTAGKIGDVQYKMEVEERQKADRAAFMEADTQASQLSSRLLLDPEKGFRNKQGKEAMDASKGYLDEFDGESAKIEKNLKNDRQKMAFRESLNRRRQAFNNDVMGHESQQREQYYENTRKGYEAAAHGNAIASYRDPKAIEAEMANLTSSTNSIPGLDADTKNMMAGEKRSRTYEAVIDRYLANGEVNDGEKYYHSIKDKVVGQSSINIESAITAAKNRQKAERDSSLALLKQDFQDELREVAATAENGLLVTSIPSEARAVALYGDSRGKKLYEMARRTQEASVFTSDLHTKKTSELNQEFADSVPKQQSGAVLDSEIHQLKAKQIAQVNRERSLDPVGYLQERSTAVKTAHEAFNSDPNDRTRSAYLSALNAERSNLEIPGNDLLSKSEEKATVERMTKQDDSTSLVNSIRSEQARWGKDFDRVFMQVGKDLPDAAYLIPNLPEKPANMLATVAGKPDDELKKMLSSGATYSDVTKDVQDELLDLKQSFPIDGVSSYSKIESATVKLAIAYMGQSMSASNAIKQAAKDVMGQHEFTEYRDHTYRVPLRDPVGRPIDTDSVKFGAHMALASVEIPSSVSGHNYLEGERLKQHVKENGYWVTAPDESGLWLFVDYQPVGKPPVSYTWDQLAKIGAAERAETDKRIQQNLVVQ